MQEEPTYTLSSEKKQAIEIATEQHIKACAEALVEAEQATNVETVKIPKSSACSYVTTIYTGEAALYLLMPQHKTLIPYEQGESKLVATINSILVKHKDMKSSDTPTDYPIITHQHYQQWYSDYEVIHVMKTVEHHIPPKAQSSWTTDQHKTRSTASRIVQNKLKKVLKQKGNPFYAMATPEEKRQFHKQIIGED